LVLSNLKCEKTKGEDNLKHLTGVEPVIVSHLTLLPKSIGVQVKFNKFSKIIGAFNNTHIGIIQN